MGKKGKKGKKDEKPPDEVNEYETMDLEMLREVVPLLKQTLAKKSLDRNYVQLERDALQQFYDISRSEVEDVKGEIAKKDRDMELMEENHRVELRVYLQKVRHLEYEHRHALRGVGEDTKHFDTEEKEAHEQRTHALKKAKTSIRTELGEREISNAEEVRELREQHAKNLKNLRLEFEEGIVELGSKCQKRLEQLETDLKMRRKVHIHEIEERKNLHINDLIRNHDKAFGQMKQYYNTITSDNLKLITSLKTEVKDMREKAQQNKVTTKDVSAENAKLRHKVEHLKKERLTFGEMKSKLARELGVEFRTGEAGRVVGIDVDEQRLGVAHSNIHLSIPAQQLQPLSVSQWQHCPRLVYLFGMQCRVLDPVAWCLFVVWREDEDQGARVPHVPDSSGTDEHAAGSTTTAGDCSFRRHGGKTRLNGLFGGYTPLLNQEG